MRLYLDSNVYAHADDLGQGRDLVEWLVDSGHEAVLSEIHLAEALAIPDVVAREGRLTLLAAVPARVSRPLASLRRRSSCRRRSGSARHGLGNRWATSPT